MDNNTAMVLIVGVPSCVCLALFVLYRLINDFFDHRQRMAKMSYDSLVLQNKLKRAVEADGNDTAPPAQE